MIGRHGLRAKILALALGAASRGQVIHLEECAKPLPPPLVPKIQRAADPGAGKPPAPTEQPTGNAAERRRRQAAAR